jgi:hypothetical protein
MAIFTREVDEQGNAPVTSNWADDDSAMAIRATKQNAFRRFSMAVMETVRR